MGGLDPELQRRLVMTWDGRLILDHPLVRVMPYDPDRDTELANRLLHEARRRVQEATAAGDWQSFVGEHERAHRPRAILTLRAKLDGPAFWELLGDAWSDTEHPALQGRLWRNLWASTLPGREHVMSPEERAALAAMLDPLAIFRGVGHRARAKGLSWTLDRFKAEWFAYRFALDGRAPYLATGTIARADVLAYLTGRGEAEIVTLSERVQGMNVERLPPAAA